MSEVVYGAESRLMEWMRKSGIIEYDSIQGGNVYGSLEGKIHESTLFQWLFNLIDRNIQFD